jgi:hypothetical protein
MKSRKGGTRSSKRMKRTSASVVLGVLLRISLNACHVFFVFSLRTESVFWDLGGSPSDVWWSTEGRGAIEPEDMSSFSARAFSSEVRLKEGEPDRGGALPLLLVLTESVDWRAARAAESEGRREVEPLPPS